jgi:hypothetical protein
VPSDEANERNPYRGGASPDQQRSERKNRQPAGKIMSKKGSIEADGESQKLRPGAPDIAHPDDRERYERQAEFVTAWFLEMLERLESTDEKSAHAARCELQDFFLNGLGQALRVGLDKKESAANKWAGELLAITGSGIGKYDKKLKANAAYAEMKKKLSGKGLTSTLFPTYVCGIVGQELDTAEKCRRSLLLLRDGCANAWAMEARWQGILEEYWPTVELPEFSVKNEPTWWEFLQPLIEKKIDVSKMPPLKLREYDTMKVSMRNGKAEMRESGKKIRKRYPSDSETTAHDHLKLRARLRDAGIF